MLGTEELPTFIFFLHAIEHKPITSLCSQGVRMLCTVQMLTYTVQYSTNISKSLDIPITFYMHVHTFGPALKSFFPRKILLL
jgi:hypothetical protein